MKVLRAQTLQARLFALAAILAGAVAIVCVFSAVVGYQSSRDLLDASQAAETRRLSAATEIWFRGALRNLAATATAIDASLYAPDACSAILSGVLRDGGGVRAIVVRRGAQACARSIEASDTTPILLARLGEEAQRGTRAFGDVAARYGVTAQGSRTDPSILARGEGGAQWEAFIVFDHDALAQALGAGSLASDADGGIVTDRSVLVSAHGASAGMGWLPEARPPQLADGSHWFARSRDGRPRVYTAAAVDGSGLFAITSFSDARNAAVETRFLVLLFAPLLILAIVFLAYVRAIHVNLTRWVRGIERAAHARAAPASARAPKCHSMPTDLYAVVTAFNDVLDLQAAQSRELETSRESNRFLILELNHRIKNSLQVVQSYIGLTKRDYRGDARRALAEAECRVQIVSAAYRGAFAQGDMGPAAVDPFLETIETSVTELLCAPGQSFTVDARTKAVLPVDRLIPLGLLAVDVASRALRSAPDVSIALKAASTEGGAFHLEFLADRDVALAVEPRLFTGVEAQAEAIQTEKAAGDRLGSWTVPASHAVAAAAPAP